MSADVARRAAFVLLLAPLAGCSWFTDFKRSPKIDPWETAADSIPFRGNPQQSVPYGGIQASGLLVSYQPLPGTIDSLGAMLTNPVAADPRSLENGRKAYQINCAICHGAAGQGNGTATKYGVPGINIVNDRVKGFSDGYIFGMMRNGRGLMPTYNRINENERWDIVNYLRGLQGAHQVVAAPAGLPGETGATLPSATELGPTRPSPYYRPVGSQAGLHLGRTAAPAPVAPTDSAAATDTTARTATPAAPAPADTMTKGERP